jgi:sterol desaturase/sphingolipid hydroxylase (fatty acid hydroxylase superfamily)
MTTSGANKKHRRLKTKAASAWEQQRLKWQQQDIYGGFGRQGVVAVALLAALATALAGQWQQWVRQQSAKKRQ